MNIADNLDPTPEDFDYYEAYLSRRRFDWGVLLFWGGFAALLGVVGWWAFR